MIGRSVYVVAVLLIVATNCEEACSGYNCEEDGKCLPDSSVCDGIEHCPRGSDETYALCKLSAEDSPYSFFCAYGGKTFLDNECNGVVECADQSDEATSLCHPDKLEKKMHGYCKENELECLIGNCIPESKMCDGTIDCPNGRDESVDLCMQYCREGLFRCANGACIDNESVCNGKPDCVDGSDELVCGYSSPPSRRCVEPTDKNLGFSNDTKYHEVNGTRYVYPNQAVRFRCRDNTDNTIGESWNVCLKSGMWHHGLLQCVSQPVNLNKDTNGVNGCPVNYYDADRMLIKKCDRGNCVIPITPPINNVTVQFSCKRGYTMTPLGYNKTEFRCERKTWVPNSYHASYTDLNCVKVCDIKRVTCQESLLAICSYKDSTKECRYLKVIVPGTRVQFICNPGYVQNKKMKSLQMECLESGNWAGGYNMDDFCILDCGKKVSAASALSKIGFTTKVNEAPWVDALYLRDRDRFQNNCTGVRIRHNLVLTAAHCVVEHGTNVPIPKENLRVGNSYSNLSWVSGDYGWSVEEIFINPAYKARDLTGDVAILKLIWKNDDFPYTICLPWERQPMSPLQLDGQIVAFNSTGEHIRLVVVAASVSTDYGEDSFHVQIKLNHNICHGDSGSGYIGNCNGQVYGPSSISCLYGLVSYSNRGLDKDGCGSDIGILDIQHIQNRDFIGEICSRFSRACSNYD